MYQRWCINKAIGIETEIGIEIRVWGMQWSKILVYLIGELKFDK